MKSSDVATTVGFCTTNRRTSDSSGVSCSGLVVQHSSGRCEGSHNKSLLSNRLCWGA
jgi:hypothetical protein